MNDSDVRISATDPIFGSSVYCLDDLDEVCQAAGREVARRLKSWATQGENIASLPQIMVRLEYVGPGAR